MTTIPLENDIDIITRDAMNGRSSKLDIARYHVTFQYKHTRRGTTEYDQVDRQFTSMEHCSINRAAAAAAWTPDRPVVTPSR